MSTSTDSLHLTIEKSKYIPWDLLDYLVKLWPCFFFRGLTTYFYFGKKK